ncbi:hypothetical protein [Pedobacter ginsengisoli]|uniref:hypothetical protein n=1 Tax=Pedobacter ginsengisoli TaxID=363852 RepID=UPI001FE9AE96|nr:hypothetical protein [Pedobacter ginsengisoli]
MSMLKILIVVTNVNAYASGNLETGLWLSELTHIYHARSKGKGICADIDADEAAFMYASQRAFYAVM